MLATLTLLALAASDPVVASPCSPAEVAALTAPAAAETLPFRLTCFATLPPGQSIQRPILFEGAEASGAGIDCNGGSIIVLRFDTFVLGTLSGGLTDTLSPEKTWQDQ